jgi:hypothetical protein
MSYESISCLRINIFDEIIPDNLSPWVFIRPYYPTTYINYAWIPQTIGYQIWILFEFKTKEDREIWENNLPSIIAKRLDRNLIPYALNFGWGSRNINGFVISN